MLLSEQFKVGKLYTNTRGHVYTRILYTDLKLSNKIGDFESTENILVVEIFSEEDERSAQILKVLTSSGLSGIARFSYDSWDLLHLC